MAFTKINAAGIGTTETVTVDGLTVINNESIGGNLTVTGNATISGVLTYEDVTNVDSVGLITARNGIVVGSGITLSKDGDGFFTGVTTATTFVGALTGNVTGNISGGTVAGSTGTFTGDVDIADKIIHTGDTNTAIRFPAADTVTVETGGSERARIDSSGRLLLGTATANSSDRFTIVDPGDAFMSIRSDAAADNTNQILDFAVGTGNRSSSNLTGTITATIHSQSGGTLKSDLKFFTNSGDSLTEKLRIDSAGRLLLNTTTEGNAGADDFTIGQITGSTGITIRSGTTNNGNLYFSDGTSGDDEYRGSIQYQHANNSLHIATNAVERVVINSSGKVNIGDTQMSSNLLNLEDGTAAAIDIASHGTGGDTAYIGVKKSAGGGLTFGISNRDIIFKTGASYSSGTTFDSGTERVRIDSNGRLLVGASSAQVISGHTPRFQMQGTEYNSQTFSIISNSADGNAAYLFFSKQRSGSVGGSTAVQNGDRIGEIRFNGHDGTDFAHETAIIASEVDGTPGTNDMPGRLLFYTCADGAGSVTERMRIDSSGVVRIGENGSFTPDTGADELVVGNANSGVNRGMTIYNSTGSDGRICFAQPGDPDAGMIKYSHGSDLLQFFSEGDELMRLNNTSVQTNDVMELRKPNGASNVQSHMIHFKVGGHDRGAVIAASSFGGSAIVGAISDYRVKTNIRDYTGGWDNIKAIPVKIFDINKEGEEATDVKGWIAHEVQSVIPEAVCGNKDAKKEDGSDDLQSLGYNVFMPDVVGALQTAMAKIETLEAKVAALEG